MESEVRFASAGLTLVGVLHEPDADGPRPAVIDLHGFGGSCSGAGHPEHAAVGLRALNLWCPRRQSDSSRSLPRLQLMLSSMILKIRVNLVTD